MTSAIERIEALPFAIPFREPFVTAKTTHTTRYGVLVRVRAPDGRTGIGEASPPPSRGEAAAREAAAILARRTGDPPPWVAFGLATARLDLDAQAQSRPLAEAVRAGARPHVAVNATIGSSDPARAAEQAARACADGFRTVKLKVAVGALEDDLARVARVRAAIGPHARIRLDANQGWSEAQAIAALARLAEHDIDYVEQPVAAADVAALARVRAASPVRVAADEAVTGPDAVRRILAARAADVLVVKPARVGGFAAAREIADLAAFARVAVAVTSTIDTSVGIAAALHLAAALPEAPLECGLATAHLLAGDVVREPLAVAGGEIALPRAPGIGVELDEAQLARWRA